MENIEKIRHSLAHLLATAVMEFWPKTKLAIGPAIENGFYYDLDLPLKLKEDHLPKLEKRMRELIAENQKFTGKKVSKPNARLLFKNQPYKLEILKELKGKNVGIEQNGNFIDLCRGGHVKSTKEINPLAFKLHKVAGAYWRGNEKNKMLTRIYGIAFETEKELGDYLKMQEEAEKRDHRKLGRELDLFTFSDLVGPGLPLFTPKGTILFSKLKDFSEALKREIGFQEVHIPHLAKIDLYKKSGHAEKFGDDIFYVKGKTSEFIIKPMNCPHHTQIYASQTRSYRDLPIKYFETTTVYRDEQAGELSGLTRVRSITQDDSHVFCREDQIEEIFDKMLSQIQKARKAFNINDLRIDLSLRDEKNKKAYLGDDKTWQDSQKTMENLLKKNGIDFKKSEGEAAFYGPKMDLIVTDALGREWQIATLQLDLNTPTRFNLEYIAKDGGKKTPVMIHSAFLGSIERFMGFIVEHFSGAFPVWLSPVQVSVIPISDKHLEYSKEIKSVLEKAGVRVELKDENETLGKKIREAEIQKVPYLLIVGEKEMQAVSVSVRQRGRGDIGQMPINKFIEKIKSEVNNKTD